MDGFRKHGKKIMLVIVVIMAVPVVGNVVQSFI